MESNNVKLLGEMITRSSAGQVTFAGTSIAIMINAGSANKTKQILRMLQG